MGINAKWFRERLADKGMSQRQLAKHLGIDPSSLTYMLKGERAMKMTEAPQIAAILGVPVQEVLTNAGVELDAPSRRVPIVGYVDGKGMAHVPDWASRTEAIPTPVSLPEDAVALRLQTVASELDMFDGWTVFTTPPKSGVPADCIGRLCIVQLKNGDCMLRFLRRGYKPGTYNLVHIGAPTLSSVSVAWATPILWIKTI